MRWVGVCVAVVGRIQWHTAAGGVDTLLILFPTQHHTHIRTQHHTHTTPQTHTHTHTHTILSLTQFFFLNAFSELNGMPVHIGELQWQPDHISLTKVTANATVHLIKD